MNVTIFSKSKMKYNMNNAYAYFSLKILLNIVMDFSHTFCYFIMY